MGTRLLFYPGLALVLKPSQNKPRPPTPNQELGFRGDTSPAGLRTGRHKSASGFFFVRALRDAGWWPGGATV